MPNPPPTSWRRAAVRPRMLGLLVLLLVAAAVCARLGVWQLDRAQVRGERSEQQRIAALEAAAPRPLSDVLAPSATFTGALVGEKVEISGVYGGDQLLVTDRVHDGRTGYLVLDPLTVQVDGGTAVLAVLRGWVADASAAGTPPSGEVTLVGYLQPGEAPGTIHDDGTTDAVSPAQLVGRWGSPIYTGALVLATSDPPQGSGLAVLEVPKRPGTGLNLQNLGYAAQWWIFGAFALLIWVRAVRDEARGPVQPVAPQPAA